MGKYILDESPSESECCEPEAVKSRDVLADLISDKFPWRGDWAIAIFDVAVCADESGIHDGARYCSLAGYIGDLEAWLAFDGAWELILAHFDVADFHSKDFFALGKNGEHVGKYNRRSSRDIRCSYGDWPSWKAERFLQELLEAIHLSKLRPVGATVDCRAFFSFSYGERRFMTGGHFDGKRFLTSGAPTKPYFLLFDHCLVDAAHATPKGKKILYVFDQQKVYQSRALEQFGESARTVVEEMQGKFAGALYLERYDAPGLQAADLYTHCWNRYITNPKGTGEMRLGALNILTLKHQAMKQYTSAHMRGMLGNLPPDTLSAMRRFPDPSKAEGTER